MILIYGSECVDSPLQAQENSSDNHPPGLEYYAIALVNSSHQWTKELLNLKESLPTDLVSSPVTESFQLSMMEFTSMEKLGLDLLNCSILSDLMPAIKNLYTPIWYHDPNGVRPIDIICDTIDDFLSDYELRLEPLLFQNLCVEFFDYITIALLKRMIHKSSRFKVDIIKDLLSYDHDQLNGIFAKFIRNTENVPLQVLDSVYPLLTSTDKTILISFYNLHREYPDVSVSFFENIISRRNDLDKSIVKTLVNSVKDHFKNTRNNIKSKSKKSIFSNL